MRNFTILNPTMTRILQVVRVGDIVERVAHPVAVALKMGCLDENQKLRAESPCGKRRAMLNGETPSTHSP